ncbi:MAG: hypothetical protein V3S11_04945 [Elusimicrobiota bacterium]
MSDPAKDQASSPQAFRYSVFGALLLGGILFYYFVLSVATVADVKLMSIGGKKVDVAKCKAETCLIVWMAADCAVPAGACWDLPEMVEDLRYLMRRGYGIPTKIVIGGGTPQACRETAMRYGSDTLIDPVRILNVRDNHEFIAIERSGKIIKTTDQPTVKWDSSAPISDDTIRAIARELGLI